MTSNLWLLLIFLYTSQVKAPAMAPGTVDFELINGSNYTLRDAWITIHGSNHWVEVLESWGLLPGGRLIIQRANPKWVGLEANGWDLRIEFKEGKIRRWEIFEALDLSHIKTVTVQIEKDGRWNTVW